MPSRVNPVILLGLIVVFILSLAISAGALQSMVPQQLTGGGAGAALSVGEAQMGKPFQMSTDGPNSFSCSGLMRYILRTIGVDGDAPWSPEGYLSKYTPVAPGDLQPGDIVIYPNWATMYAGNGMLLDSNEVLGYVTHTPMDVAGTPEGIVRPYSSQPSSNNSSQPPSNNSSQPPSNNSSQPSSNNSSQPSSNNPLPQVPLDQTTDPLPQAPLDQAQQAPLDQAQQAPLDQVTDPLPQAPLDQTTDPLAQPPLP